MQRSFRIALAMAVLSLLLLVPLFFVGKVKKKYEAESGRRIVMGTFCRVFAVAGDRRTANAAIEEAFKQLKKIESLMSVYRSDSEVAKINRDAYRVPVKVGESTFEVLKESIKFSRLSEGAFDITVGPLIDLWHHAGEANEVPSQKDLTETEAQTGYEKLKLDANSLTVRFAVDGMKIDLGGIAKGYGIDKAIEAMKARGAIGGLVDAGGDIRCFGSPPPGKQYWMVGVQDPQRVTSSPPGNYLMVLNVTDKSVTTSGDYERFVSVGGVHHSHIINPHTGQGAAELSSATIIADNATEADALATTVSVMGMEKGLALIESKTNAEVILISAAPAFKLQKTRGADKFINQDLK